MEQGPRNSRLKHDQGYRYEHCSTACSNTIRTRHSKCHSELPKYSEVRKANKLNESWLLLAQCHSEAIWSLSHPNIGFRRHLKRSVRVTYGEKFSLKTMVIKAIRTANKPSGQNIILKIAITTMREVLAIRWRSKGRRARVQDKTRGSLLKTKREVKVDLSS